MRLCGRQIGPRPARWLITAIVAVASSTASVHAFQVAPPPPAPDPAPVQAPVQGPVATLNDSVLARESIARARELAAGGNLPEALRILQNLLDTDAEKVLEVAADTHLHITVRRHVHDTLRANAALLERYREQEEPKAKEMLDRGELRQIETSRFLTPSGLVAVARIAQTQLDLGHFEAARQVLEQIADHPDRTRSPEAISTAARVASTIAALVPRDDTTALATSLLALAKDQGIAVAPSTATPLPPGIVVRTVFDSSPALDATKIAPVSLRAIPLDNPNANAGSDFSGFNRNPTMRDEAIVFPAIAGDLLLVNDGTQVTALDKDTFSPRWSIKPGEQMDAVPRFTDDPFAIYASGRAIEDPLSVTSSDFARNNVVVATTGVARNGRRNGDGRVHGIEASTGRVLWSTEPQILGPGFEGASIRGPACIDADTVILSIRRQGQGGRDTTAMLIGLDLYTGSLRWSTTLAVVGRLPWQVSQRRSDALTLHRGVAYYADEIGVVAAIETHTGRPAWVRRTPTAGSFNAQTFSRGTTFPPHTIHVPILANNDLFLLESGELGNQRILRLDSRTGSLKDARDATLFGEPRYLVRAGDFLVAVGENRVASVPLNNFAGGTIHATPTLVNVGGPSDGKIIGRVIVAGNQIVIPLTESIAILDNPEKTQDVRFLPLPGSGNLLLADGSLLAADLSTLRSFVRWEEASEQLKARIAKDPQGVDAMLALVDLSLRAGRPADAAPIAEKALDALDMATASGPEVSNPYQAFASPASQRRRLFDTLFPILIPPLPEGAAPISANADSKVATRPGSIPAINPATLPVAVQDSLITSLDRAAEEPLERASFLLSLGTLRDWRHEPAKAIEAYQLVLGDPRLDAIEPLAIVGSAPGRRAGDEASLRLVDLVSREGTGAYAVYADEAARAVRALTGSESAQTLAALARRYPLAPASIDLWSKAASQWAELGHTAAAVTARGHAFVNAQTLLLSGSVDAMAAFGNAGVALVNVLGEAGMHSSAYRLANRLVRDQPMSIILAGQSPLDLEVRRDQLRQRVLDGNGTPKIGTSLTADPVPGIPAVSPQSLAHWRPADLLLGPGPGSPTDCVALLSPTTGQVGLFLLRPETGDLQPAWTRAYQPFAPTILRIDLDATYLFWPGTKGGTVEAIDNADGSTLWKTDEFASLFPGEPKRPGGERFPVPLAGEVRATDLVVSMDEQTLLLIERGGRVAAFDLASGKTLWARPIELTRVYDVAGSGPFLLAGGNNTQGEGPDDATPSIVATSKRTGDPGPIVNLTGGESAKLSPEEHVRWLRADAKGHVVVALTSGLACIDPATGGTIWDQREGGTKGAPLTSCVAGLVARDKILVVDGNQQIFLVPITTGDTAQGPLPTNPLKRTHAEFPIRLNLHGEHLVLTGSKGALVYDFNGTLVGADALDPDLMLVNPLVTRENIVTMSQMSAAFQPIPGRIAPANEDAFELVFLDVPGARLAGRFEILAVEEPTEMTAVDGKLILTASAITFVLDAPPAEPAKSAAK